MRAALLCVLLVCCVAEWVTYPCQGTSATLSPPCGEPVWIWYDVKDNSVHWASRAAFKEWTWWHALADTVTTEFPPPKYVLVDLNLVANPSQTTWNQVLDLCAADGRECQFDSLVADIEQARLNHETTKREQLIKDANRPGRKIFARVARKVCQPSIVDTKMVALVQSTWWYWLSFPFKASF